MDFKLGVRKSHKNWKKSMKYSIRDRDSGVSSASDLSENNKSPDVTCNNIARNYKTLSPKVVLTRSAFIEELVLKQFNSIGDDSKETMPKTKSQRSKQCSKRTSQRYYRKMGRHVSNSTKTVKNGDSDQIIPALKIKFLNDTNHKKRWKRSNDVPTDILRITSYDNIFQGALIGENDNRVIAENQSAMCSSDDECKISSDNMLKLDLISNRSRNSRKVLFKTLNAKTHGQYDMNNIKIKVRNSLQPLRKNYDFSNSSLDYIHINPNQQEVTSPKPELFETNLNDNKLPKDITLLLTNPTHTEEKVTPRKTQFFPINTIDKKLPTDKITILDKPLCNFKVEEEFVINNASNTFVSQKTFDNKSDDDNFAKPQGDLRLLITTKRKNIFKAPLLPLSKRPPGRDKSPFSIGQPKVKTSTARDDFDAISLFAESIHDMKCDEINEGSDFFCTTSQEGTVQESDAETPNLPQIVENENERTNENEPDCQEEDKQSETVENVSEIVHPCIPETVQDNVKEWIASSSVVPPPLVIPQDLIVKRYLRRFCFRNFTKYCSRSYCKFFHYIPEEFKNAIESITPEVFQTCYVYSCKYPLFYRQMFPHFVSYLKSREKTETLINMLDHILRAIPFDKTPFIRDIILALQNLGFTFAGAIEEILLIQGLQKECLLDILIMLFVEQVDSIENNWFIIQKLVKPIKKKIDCTVMNEIVKKCVETTPPNQQLLLNLFQDLLAKDCVDLDKIKKELLISYANLLFNFNMKTCAEHIMKLTKIQANEINHPLLMQQARESTMSSKSSVSSFCEKSETLSSDPTQQHNKQISTEGDFSNEYFQYHKSPSIGNVSLTNESKNIKTPTKLSVVDVEPRQLPPTKCFLPSLAYDFNTFDQGYHNRYANNYFTSPEIAFQFNLDKPVTEDNLQQRLSINNSIDREDLIVPPTTESYFPSLTSLTHFNKQVPILTDVCDEDILKLSEAIKSGNISDFLSLLHRYSSPNCAKSFVGHVITMMNNANITNSDSASIFMDNIFSDLSSNNFDQHTKNAVNLLAFNILPFLDKNRQYRIAYNILSKFTNDISKFVETELIQKTNEYLSTTDLKYAFIFKIFCRGGKLREALKLLKSPELNLFEKYFCAQDSKPIIDYKKRIMNEFISFSLKSNILVAKELVYFLMLNSYDSEHIDVIWLLNELIIKMLNKYGEYRLEIMTLLENILNGWYKCLHKFVLRALLVQLYYELPDRKIFEIFHLCSSAGIYAGFNGLVNCVKLNSNLLKEEICLILYSYFHKISNSNCPVERILLSLDEPMIDDYQESGSCVNVFIKTSSRKDDMQIRVLNVLKYFTTSMESIQIAEQFIVIPSSNINSILSLFKGGSMPQLFKFT